MSFSYTFGANPAIDYPRLLVSDTQDVNHIFEDEEITSAANIVAGTFQSSQRYTTGAFTFPSLPVSYYRVAALLLTALSTNKARLSSVTKLLDVELDPSRAAKALKDQAAAYLEMDDNSGAFAVIEQVNSGFSFADRFWNQIQRQSL